MYPISREQAARYSRQLLIPGFGVESQLSLLHSSVLIVGCGGLGSPCALYLASSGVGRLGLLDYDRVELTNLHRQIIHSQQTIGLPKTHSAAQRIKELNSSIIVEEHPVVLNDPQKALELISKYSLVVDCSDNGLTRYLVNDVCMRLGIPLVSGSALRWEGHLCTFLPRQASPCYRCLYPVPTPAEAVTNCDSGGILPPVVGVIGSLQAMEAIKVLTKQEANYAGRMCIYDGMAGTFRTVKLKSARTDCIACSLVHKEDAPELLLQGLPTDYAQFGGGSGVCDKTAPLQLLNPLDRISPAEVCLKDYALVIDVRPPEQFAIGALPGALNYQLAELEDKICAVPLDTAILVVCRRGNQSQRAVLKLRSRGFTNVHDLIGGVSAYALQVDPDFPLY